MRRTLRHWAVGGGVIAFAVGVYLLFTPPGRALLFALGGPTPGAPRAEVEGALGEPDGPAPGGNTICIGLIPGMTLEDIDRCHELRERCVQYLGPLYAVEVSYVGFRHPRFVSVSLKWRPTWAGMLKPFGLVLFGVVAVSRQFRIREATTGGLA